MIPKIQKVLYATDLSKNSAYAFRYAGNFSITPGTELLRSYLVFFYKIQVT